MVRCVATFRASLRLRACQTPMRHGAGIMDQSAILASEAGKLTMTTCMSPSVRTVAPPWPVGPGECRRHISSRAMTASHHESVVPDVSQRSYSVPTSNLGLQALIPRSGSCWHFRASRPRWPLHPGLTRASASADQRQQPCSPASAGQIRSQSWAASQNRSTSARMTQRFQVREAGRHDVLPRHSLTLWLIYAIF